jgi:hypothetical protein
VHLCEPDGLINRATCGPSETLYSFLERMGDYFRESRAWAEGQRLNKSEPILSLIDQLSVTTETVDGFALVDLTFEQTGGGGDSQEVKRLKAEMKRFKAEMPAAISAAVCATIPTANPAEISAAVSAAVSAAGSTAIATASAADDMMACANPNFYMHCGQPVTWSDVHGADAVKLAARDFFLSLQYPRAWQNAKPQTCLLLAGPPGTGKTSAARAIAHHVTTLSLPGSSRAQGQSFTFFTPTGTDIKTARRNTIVATLSPSSTSVPPPSTRALGVLGPRAQTLF